MTIAAGTKLGRYEIRSQIGEGGMGEVYLAEDTKLDRKVALKILPAGVAAHPDRMKRFVQEAKAASALNHPNIITIYEIDDADSINFMAIEFIDGETLRERMRNAQMNISETLDIGVQIASAFAAAHAVGIVHRDIKPENIMVRRDDIVKVLDFGLAKLTERTLSESVDREASTRAAIKTEPGAVMGTATYMSPEQARGLQVDARTDIFSLGAVLYEMLTGRPPFEGSTSSEVVASILGEKEPQPLARYSRDVPSELERIVSKALRKKRDQRYQTIKDLLLDLKSLQQELEFAKKLERSAPPKLMNAVGTSEQALVGTAGESVPRPTAPGPGLATTLLHKRNVVITVTALLIIVAVVGVYFYWTRVPSGTINSIAVLPLVNGSNDPETEYLSDGVAESLINNLSQLPNLKVMSLNSVVRYKGRGADAQTVGRELGVEAVLTGKVTQRGDNLSISVELVRVRDNTHIWGEQYSRKLSDLLAVQGEISHEVLEKLRQRLTGEEERRAAKRYTDNSEAYQLYLWGRYFLNRRTPEGFAKGIGYFRQAIEKDPAYASAYAGLADGYVLLGSWQILPPNETFPKARAAAEKAVQLDDSLAEAHTSLADVKARSKDWSGAQAEHKRAIELNPNSEMAHLGYAAYLWGLGQLDEAMAEIKRAQELDPRSLNINTQVGRVFYLMRQYDQAIAQYQKALEMDPNFAVAHFQLGWAYEKKEMYEEAIAEYQKTISLRGQSEALAGIGGRGGVEARIGRVYALSGKKREAQKVLDTLKEMSKQSYVSPLNMAIIYDGLGEKEQAIAWLEKALAEGGTGAMGLKVNPTWDRLRPEPRFQDLLRRMGLPP